MKNTMKVALCGVIAALSAVVMFLSGVVPVATLALPALAGCLLIPVVAELGRAWGFGVYAVCGVLSFLLVPDREAVLFYLLFFGYYPVFVSLLGRVHKKALRYGVKFLVFNAAFLAEALLTLYVLGVPMDDTGFLGKAAPLVLLVLGNLMFFLYDLALDGLIATYFQKLHPRLRKFLRRGGG